jgi:hypothetical protein
MVVRAGVTRRGALRGCLAALSQARRPFLGVVLNDFRPGPLARYSEYSYYSYVIVQCSYGKASIPQSSQFSYDRERDEYQCPEGHPLPRWTAKYTEELTVYRADAATCNACPVKGACTASERGRTILRSFHAEYLERVQAYHETPGYQKAMRKRSVWVEPLFGEAKQ